jgi:hypothetical protein
VEFRFGASGPGADIGPCAAAGAGAVRGIAARMRGAEDGNGRAAQISSACDFDVRACATAMRTVNQPTGGVQYRRTLAQPLAP